MTRDTEIMKASAPTVNFETLIQRAIDKGVSVDTMERIVAMRKDLKAEWAKEQYDLAMMAFQNECPVLRKSKTVNTNAGAKAYSYAPLESIVTQVKALLVKHGFSYQIQTGTLGKEKEVVATCIARHQDGHSESSNVQVPLGNKTAVMSDTQVVAAALTFAKRYAFCNVFGILTGDEDNNSAPSGKQDSEVNPRAAFDKAAIRMRATKSLDGLKMVWDSLTAKERKDDELVEIKNEMKKKMS